MHKRKTRRTIMIKTVSTLAFSVKSIAKKWSGSCAAAMAVATVSLGGCSGGTGSNGDGSGQPSSGPTEVGSVSVFDAKVTFYSRTLTGNTEIGMLETGSAFAKARLVSPLLDQGLTTQEIYLALAPKGAAAPPALVAAQAFEAARMGRSAEVRHVTVDGSALVEKGLLACESAIFTGTPPPDGSQYHWSVDTSFGGGIVTDCTSLDFPGSSYGVCTNTTTDWVIMGGCNDGSGTIFIRVIEGYGGANGSGNCNDFYEIGSYNMATNYYAYWYWSNSGGASYDIATTSAGACSGLNYDMLIANEVHN
jgi:hypothetical protein